MTAEIALLNKSSVALAADSALTTRDGKIYNNAHKIFTLSKYHPIGIMIYNVADFMGVPWATIIKMYRTHLGERKMDTVQDYAKHFLKYLLRNNISSPKEQDNHVYSVLNFQFGKIMENEFEIIRNEFIDPKTEIGNIKKEIADKFDEKIIERINYILKNIAPNKDIFSLLKNPDSKKIIKKYENSFIDVMNSCFPKKQFSSKILKLFKELAENLLIKRFDFNKDLESGIVFSGFGENEMFPSLLEYRIDGVIDGKLRGFLVKEISIDRNETTAYIKSFAQTEMIQRFMTGIDGKYQNYIDALIEDILEEYSKIILKQAFPRINDEKLNKLLDKIKLSKVKLIDTYDKAIEDFQESNFSKPIIDSVTILPKEDLAKMAESLISITSMKRRVSSNELETVGGSIDVALISKEDGFIWVKRKHYFNQELNPFFIQKYFNKIEVDKND